MNIAKFLANTFLAACAAAFIGAAPVWAADTETRAPAAQESAGNPSDGYKEGTDYEVRGQKKSEKPEIREFFSFWCGHCFMMLEPFDVVRESFEGRAEFLRNPVEILGGEMGEESQHGYAVAKMLGIEDLYTQALFDKIHIKNEIPESHEDFVELFASIGIPEGTFESNYKSFPVQGLVAQYQTLTKDLAIEAVPEIIVNRKYLVKMDKLETVQDLNNVIEYLLTLD